MAEATTPGHLRSGLDATTAGIPPQAPGVILASSSPSRLAILRAAGIEPEVRVSGVDEDAVVARLADPSPESVVRALAEAKAAAVVSDLNPAAADGGDGRRGEGAAALPASCIVIGADSMLLIDGELQGKPHTQEETVRRWHAQRGRTAELLTGHAVIGVGGRFGPGTGVVSEVSRTRITFAPATDADIAAYAATGEPFGCAGAFTLEALGGWFIDRIEGDPSGVIGLSLPTVRRAVEALGVDVSSLWSTPPHPTEA